VQRVDDLIGRTWTATFVFGGEASGGEHVQVCDDLQWCFAEGVHLAWNGSGHGDRCTHGAAHGGILLSDSCAHRRQRHLGTFERRTCSGTLQSRFGGDVRGIRAHSAIPQHLIDLFAGCQAGGKHAGKFG